MSNNCLSVDRTQMQEGKLGFIMRCTPSRKKCSAFR